MLKLSRFFFDQAISIDNALTTNQIIHQIINQLNEVVDYVNSLETDAHEYTDAKVLELKTQLEHQISELETFLKGYADTKLVDAKNYTDSEIANLRLNYIDVKISEIYETITALESRLDAKIDYTDAKLTNLIDSVKSELIELIKKGNSIIYSGYTGLLTALQDEIHNIYNVYSKFFGLTWAFFEKYLATITALNFTGVSGYSTNKITKIGDIELFGAPYEYSIVDNGDDTINVSCTFPYNVSASTTNARINTTDVIDDNFIISADRRTITINNIPLSSLSYSMNRIDFGGYVNSAWSNNYSTYLSNLDAEYKTVMTWATLDRLILYDHIPYTWDMVTFYFFTQIELVNQGVIKETPEANALYATLKDKYYFASTGNLFGASGQPMLQGITSKIANTVKAVNYFLEV